MKKQGYVITEMIVAVALIGVLALLVGELFIVSFNAMQKATRRDNLLHRTDAAIRILRQDTWSAEKITIDAPNAVHLSTSSGNQITWQLADDGTLIRTAQQTQSWPDFPPLHFSSTGPLLTLTLHAESLTLPSQPLLQRSSP